jgi:hypothetical protein
MMIRYWAKQAKRFTYSIIKFLVEDYRLVGERRFARPNDAESYAGGSVSSW